MFLTRMRSMTQRIHLIIVMLLKNMLCHFWLILEAEGYLYVNKVVLRVCRMLVHTGILGC